MRFLCVLPAMLVLCLCTLPGEAATKLHRPKPKPVVARPAAPPPAPAIAPPEPPPPPYEPQLLRLAELMGALSYLRDLCQDGDGNVWRARMSAIIDAEATTPARREKLAGAYNKGFRGYEITYRQCTANAQAIVTRFLDEGTRIVHEIGSRYSSS